MDKLPDNVRRLPLVGDSNPEVLLEEGGLTIGGFYYAKALVVKNFAVRMADGQGLQFLVLRNAKTSMGMAAVFENEDAVDQLIENLEELKAIWR